MDPVQPDLSTGTAAEGDAPSPRADLVDGAAWLVLGTAVLIGALTMDRLEDQDVPSYTAPGLLPGLLGIALLLFGGMMTWRSLRRGALTVGAAHTSLAQPLARGRALLVIGLCVAFGVVLVGHGLPFWMAATLFVATAILVLPQNQSGGVRPKRGVAAVGSAVLTGLGAGWAITIIFQQIFLVRLP